MNRTGEQGATTTMLSVLVANPIFAIITAFIGIRCFGNIFESIAKLKIRFAKAG